jgi:hypothetical protein
MIMNEWYIVVGAFPRIYVLDHGDGTYSQFKHFGPFGPSDRRGPLKPGIQIVPVTSNKDRRNVRIIEENVHRGNANKRVIRSVFDAL